MLIVDTSGRLHIDEELMKELADIKKRLRPHNVLLVVDAMTGQDAVNVAEQFAETAQFDGVVMTKLDGDARGGAALSIKAVTGKPILYGSTGEKLAEFEPFHPDRMASRILGMGDVLSFIEKAEKTVDADRAQELERKIRKQQFGFDDFLDQMKQVRRMGPLGNLMGMLPGFGQLKQLKGAKVDERELDRIEAIVTSMTPEERRSPQLIDGSRRKRIAAGLGDHRSGREPAGQAVRPDAEDDAPAPAGQDALDGPADARRQVGGARCPILPGVPQTTKGMLGGNDQAHARGRTQQPDLAGRRDGPALTRATGASSRCSATTTRRPTRRRSSSTRRGSVAGSRRARSRAGGQAAAEGEGDRLKQLLEFLAKTLVDHPDQVGSASTRRTTRRSCYELIVAEEDRGKVIGRSGRTAKALRAS